MPMFMDFMERTKVCILVLVCDCVCVYMYIEVHNPNVGLSLFFPNTTAATTTTSKLYRFSPHFHHVRLSTSGATFVRVCIDSCF